MKISEARAYVDRWEAVAEIKQQELQSASIAEKWRQLNSIRRRAARLDITGGDNNGEIEIFLRWAKLKAEHASSRKKSIFMIG
ncbi:MAG: hypothetical protein MAG431_01358 [Chloroflexi bacterium]|nr:hypothetical protein [Chloroflexota bacterium]